MMRRPRLFPLSTPFRLLCLLWGCALLVPSDARQAVGADRNEPMIVAHRAGTADAPENTVLAIRRSLANGADALWLSVQLSADGVPVLYRPQDLSALTPAQGQVSSRSAKQLAQLNAGWHFKAAGAGADTDPFPYRHTRQDVGIPTLARALAVIPANVPVFLDLKALPAAPLVDAVAQVLEGRRAWNRVWLYSTDASFDAAWQRYPRAQVMEARDVTRARLLGVALAQRCERASSRSSWAAFELRRPLRISERYTLGEGVTELADAQLWTPQAISCFRSLQSPSQVQVRLLWIGVASAADFQQAAALGVDAVLLDSPAQASQWRSAAKPDQRALAK